MTAQNFIDGEVLNAAEMNALSTQAAGALQTANNLSEIAAAGATAQAAARANIGAAAVSVVSQNRVVLVSAPSINQVCQRDSRSGGTGGIGSGGIPITVNLPTGATILEWQLLDFTTQTILVPWTSLGAQAAGNLNLTTRISAPAALRFYAVQLRVDGNATTVISTTAPFTIGEVVAMWGQSHLNAFFQQRYAPNGTIATLVPSATPWGWALIGFNDIAYPAVGNAAEDFENPVTWSTPTDSNALGYTGCGLAELMRILVARLGCPVGIVGYAYGGSSITTWQPGAANFNVLQTIITTSGSKIGTIVKLQGSADFSLSTAQYLTDLQNTHGQIRALFGAAFPFGEVVAEHPDVLASGTLGVPSDAQVENIVTADAAYAGASAFTPEFVGTLVGIQLITVDNVHETQVGAVQIAAHLARAICRAMGLETHGDDGPVLGSPTRAAGSAVISVPVTAIDGATITLDAAPGTLSSPYRVFNSSTELHVSSLTYVAGNLMIILSTTPADSAALTLRPFYGVENPTWNQYLRDNYTMGVAGVTEGRHVKWVDSLTVPAPGGSGGPSGSTIFSSTANTLQWLSGDNTNNSASSILDKSGNARPATQPTGGNQPSVISAGLGGKNVLGFNGTSDYLIIDDLATVIAGAPRDLHIFMVVKVSASTTFPKIFGFSTAADTVGANETNQFLLWQVDNPGWSGGRFDQSTSNGNYQMLTSTPPDGTTWRIVEITQQANGTGGIAIDGGLPVFASSPATEALTFTNGAIGAWRFNSGANVDSFTTFQLAEWAVIGRYLAPGAERFNILSALNTYWGMGKTIPSETGGGGSSLNSGAFTSTANVVQWLSANNSANTGGGTIVDMSGNGKNATQPTVGQQPAVTTGPNGNNVLSFDGASSNLIIDNMASVVTGVPLDLHFFMLVNCRASTVYPKVFGFSTPIDLGGYGSTYNQFLLLQIDQPGWSGGRANNNISGHTNYQTITTDASDGATWRIFEFVQRANGLGLFAVDGGSFATSATACTDTLNFTMGTIGAFRSGSGPVLVDWCNMQLAEWAVVTRYIAPGTERHNILEALNTYWGLGKTIP